jgi:hypothetical protein
MLGLGVDAEKHQINFEPHVPSDWTSFAVHGLRVGEVGVDFQYRKTFDSVILETRRNGTGECSVEFSPAFSLRTEIVSVEMNGKPLPFKAQANQNDQHVSLRFPVHDGPNTLTIRTKKDFGLSYENLLPSLGSASRELRVLSESWNPSKTQLTLSLSGLPGRRYEMAVWNPGQVGSVDGAVLSKAGKLEIQMPAGEGDSYIPHSVILHFEH